MCGDDPKEKQEPLSEQNLRLLGVVRDQSTVSAEQPPGWKQPELPCGRTL